MPPTWEEIVEQHSARVYRLAYRLTGNPHDAEDLTHDVFIRVFRSLHSYQPGTFEGWLHRITTNVFLDKMRRKQRIRFDALSDESAARLPSREAGPEQAFDATHFDDDVQRALDALPPGLPRRRRAVRHRGPVLRGDRRDARRQARHRALAHPPRPRPAARGPGPPRPRRPAPGRGPAGVRRTELGQRRLPVLRRPVAGVAVSRSLSGSPAPMRRCLGPELSAYADRAMARRDLLQWDRHLVACTVCRQAVDAERRLLAALRASAGPAVPGDLRAMLLSLGARAEAGPDAGDPAGDHDSARGVPSGTSSPTRGAPR